LALSKSGESGELADLIEFTRRFSIPLISITTGAENALARAADIAIGLPDAPEACPNGLAPTTSTTLALVLGDALAIALLEDRNFTAEDFSQFHPGGKLGAKLLKVEDLMHGKDEMPLTTPDTKMADALITMTEGTFGCVGVTGPRGELIGIVTDGDLRRKMSAELLTRSVEDVMTRDPRTIEKGALAAEALSLMTMKTPKITGLFVLDGSKPVGILHIHDLLRAGVA
jgi:arabinose-5-phosphate isomerase